MKNQAGRPGRETRQGSRQVETRQAGRETRQASRETKQAGREWRCLACGFAASPDGKGYSQLLNHTCPAGKMRVALVDKASDEVLATHIVQAQQKGLIPKKQAAPPIIG